MTRQNYMIFENMVQKKYFEIKGKEQEMGENFYKENLQNVYY